MPKQVCPRCGTEFVALRSDARYCRSACRAAAWRAREGRIRDLMRLHTAVVQEGMALKSMDAVRPELARIGAELDQLLAA